MVIDYLYLNNKNFYLEKYFFIIINKHKSSLLDLIFISINRKTYQLFELFYFVWYIRK